MIFDTSVWWILLALASYMAVGAIWYSPLLFAKHWMKAIGKAKDQMTGPGPAMAVTVVAELVIVLTLAWLADGLNLHDAVSGALLGAKLWLGLVATTALINRLFQGLRLNLYFIDMVYHLVGMVLAGAIVTL